MNRPLRVGVAAALLLATLLPVGCFASSQEASDASSPPATGAAVAPLPPEATREGAVGVTTEEYSLSDEDAVKSAGAGSNAALSSEPMIIRNGAIELRVDDVEKALPAIKDAARAHGADVAEMSVSGGSSAGPEAVTAAAGPSYATITLRVPAAKLEALTTVVAELGDVVSQSETSSDVTEQAVDMEARLKNLRAEEERLRTFLDRADKVEDLLAVQRELSRVRGDIEAMDAQLTYLKRQVARATLVVTLTEPGPVVGPDNPWYGIREAFSNGVQGAIEVVEFLITLAIAAMPLVLVAGLLVWAIVRLVRRGRAKRTAAAEASQTVAAEPAGPSQES